MPEWLIDALREPAVQLAQLALVALSAALARVGAQRGKRAERGVTRLSDSLSKPPRRTRSRAPSPRATPTDRSAGVSDQ